MNIIRLCLSPYLALALAASVASADEYAPQAATPVCMAPFNKILSDSVFNNYAIHLTNKIVSPSPPNVKSGRAHLYRTVINDEAKVRAKFRRSLHDYWYRLWSRHYMLSDSECERRRCLFPPNLKSADALLVDTGKVNVETMNYRRDSRLLIVVGSPNEKLIELALVIIFGNQKLKPYSFHPCLYFVCIAGIYAILINIGFQTAVLLKTGGVESVR